MVQEKLEEQVSEELEAEGAIEEVEVLEEPVPEQLVHPNPVIRLILSAKQLLVDFYEANFKSSEPETEKPKASKIDSSPRALREDFERRSKRSVGHITGNSVSSTRGNPTRQKKVKVTAKTYKPELDRF